MEEEHRGQPYTGEELIHICKIICDLSCDTSPWIKWKELAERYQKRSSTSIKKFFELNRIKLNEVRSILEYGKANKSVIEKYEPRASLLLRAKRDEISIPDVISMEKNKLFKRQAPPPPTYFRTPEKSLRDSNILGEVGTTCNMLIGDKVLGEEGTEKDLNSQIHGDPKIQSKIIRDGLHKVLMQIGVYFGDDQGLGSIIKGENIEETPEEIAIKHCFEHFLNEKKIDLIATLFQLKTDVVHTLFRHFSEDFDTLIFYLRKKIYAVYSA